MIKWELLIIGVVAMLLCLLMWSNWIFEKDNIFSFILSIVQVGLLKIVLSRVRNITGIPRWYSLKILWGNKNHWEAYHISVAFSVLQQTQQQIQGCALLESRTRSELVTVDENVQKHERSKKIMAGIESGKDRQWQAENLYSDIVEIYDITRIHMLFIRRHYAHWYFSSDTGWRLVCTDSPL